MRRIVAALVGLSGCGGSGGGGDAAVDLTMDQAIVDLTTVDLAGGAIGAPCAATSDCHEGRIPLCWTRYYLNTSGNAATPSGYCTSKCASDADCGATGLCIDEGSQGKFCFSPCTVPTDCRTGYGCFTRMAGHCFPSGNLICDPTVPQGLCTGGTQACIRYALGTGNTGYCFDLCGGFGGPGSCSQLNGERHCLVTDRTGDRDLQGNVEGDTFHGPYCVGVAVPNADGTECLSASGNDFLDDCIDGDECWLASGGDRKCHPLCAPAPDGGVGDGGAGCTCRDIFKLFNSQWPIGLCL
jgi:hypothetical protein